MRRVRYIIFVMISLVALQAESRGAECEYWYSQVDPKTDSELELDESDPNSVLKGIECLLKLEGKRSEGAFGGATRDEVSQILPTSTVEICALYYISYLYSGDWKHASGVALVGSDGKLNSPSTIRVAFAEYRKWFRKVKSMGLAEARTAKVEPLGGSRIRWF